MRINSYNELITYLENIISEEKYNLNNDEEFTLIKEDYHNINYPDIKRNSFIMKRDQKGIYTSFPNDEVIKDKFTIRVKRRDVYIPKHRHEYIEIVYVLEGQVIQNINGQQIKMEKGDICILDKNVQHNSEALKKNDVVINMLLTADFFDGVFMNLLSDNNHISNFIVNSLYSMNATQKYITYHVGEKNILNIIIERLLIEYFSEETRSMSAINGYLLIFFTELSRGLTEIKEDAINMFLKPLKNELRKYIKENFKNCNLKDMAEHFHFHPNYLSNLIKREFGKNLKDILMEFRMAEATNLLKNTDMTIENILNEIGYTNNSYFYKIFKKKYGCTPVDYRKENCK
ncbi:AraC family transcriptional regulator [Enterococcus casseliflavus]|uniref:AraC family transcriptional regulator n=1 Tax=Enterococcus casseliflavus TaxID=37734 RepID=UPI001784D7CE|nr:AraC family transcriptional regulator [Enterococcus casseliflavus]QOG29390.1 AraC family transcriptional regulator [Enterococcus casseliflavus]